MLSTRRKALLLGFAGAATLGITPGPWTNTLAQTTGVNSMPATIMSGNGEIRIVPINHASLALLAPRLTIYVDPVGNPQRYADLPRPDLILITHEHGDHFELETVSALASDQTTLVTNPAVYEKLSADLQLKTNPMRNGDITQIVGTKIEAIPAYNTTPERTKFHPNGRDNGYIVTINGTKIYIAGDTEDTPEMRALTNIALAFIPMNLPYTMNIDQAAEAVLAFAPKVVYPYHYKESDTAAFKAAVNAANTDIEVRLHDWYAD